MMCNINKALNEKLGFIMKKRILALAMACVLSFSLCGCLDDLDEYDEYVEDSEDGEYEDKDYEDTSSAGQGGASIIKGLSMSVNDSDGQLVITRENVAEAEKPDDNTWTIFVYLCGTDLESDDGCGTGDFDEMLAAASSENVRFVVQTGGTNEWNMDVDSEKFQRFVVQNGDMELVDEQPLAGMGTTDSLSSFISWGVENYGSEHIGLVLWNHGGGSITGVCFDEMYDNDSLDLTEVDNALYNNLQANGRKFDFIGFDACLMGTVEMANILASYADYMYGSEEMEPGGGWNYTSIGDFLAENSDANGEELGKAVCDSYLQTCIEQDDSDIATLSVIDLSKVDDLLVSFNTFAKNMYDSSQDEATRAEIVRGIEEVDNFGGNNKSEGYTNMVDMGGIVSSAASYADGAEAVTKAIDDAVIYSVSGSTHEGASGLSMYYPLAIQGSNELAMFGKISISPYYLSFVDRQGHGAVTSQAEEEYDDESWFDDEGEWCGAESSDDEYWSYIDEYEQTGESSYITFEQEPDINDEGVFCFKLDDNGYNNASSVSALVYEDVGDDTYIEMGETIDIDADWDTGEFRDAFDGYWLSLPDGQNLAMYIAEITDDYLVYTSPILLNGEETNLRMKRDFDSGEVTVEGAWAGISDDGCASRDIVKIQDGDKITPVFYSYTMDGEDAGAYEGDEFTVSGDIEITYDVMFAGDYLYGFCIDDIYGDYYMTDFVGFNISEDGEITFN